MKHGYKSGGLRRLMSIPTMLAVLRIALLPLMIVLYSICGRHGISALLLLVSVLAGLAAEVLIRRYDMTTEAGAALSAVAGGMTCVGLLLCLASHFRRLLIPAGLLLLRCVRDLIQRILRKGATFGFGDCARICLYLLLFAHLLWRNILVALSIVLTAAACVLILFPFLYDLFRQERSSKEF